MRKLFLAHFSFTLDEVKQEFHRLVIVEKKEVPYSIDPCDDQEEFVAKIKARRWFEANYPKGELNSATVYTAITGYGENVELEPEFKGSKRLS